MAISIQTVVFLLLLCIFNIYFISRKKLEYVFLLLFLLLMFIPPELVGLISGFPYSTPRKVNPSMIGYDVVIVLILLLLINDGKLRILRTNYNRIKYIFIGLFVIFSLRIVVDGIEFFSNKVLDNYLLPVLFMILIANYMPIEKVPRLLKGIYIAIFINAIVACVEYFVGKSLFFHEYYLNTVNWYSNVYNSTAYGIAFRCTAFLGHPLTNGMYFLMGVVYIFNTISKWNILKLAQLGILCGAMFATNSRGVILIFIVYVLYYLISNKKGIDLCILVFIGGIFFLHMNFQVLYDRLFARDATGSSLAVRVLALQNITNISLNKLLFGVGYNNASSVFRYYLNGTNAEISYLIILLENGFFGLSVWLFSLVTQYSKNMSKIYESLKIKGMIKGMLFCFLSYGATSNSFGDPGTLNYLLCALLAFSQIFCKDTCSRLKLNVQERMNYKS